MGLSRFWGRNVRVGSCFAYEARLSRASQFDIEHFSFEGAGVYACYVNWNFMRLMSNIAQSWGFV